MSLNDYERQERMRTLYDLAEKERMVRRLNRKETLAGALAVRIKTMWRKYGYIIGIAVAIASIAASIAMVVAFLINSKELLANYGQVISLCQDPQRILGLPRGTLPPLGSHPRIVVVHADTSLSQLHPWHDLLPQEWQASNAEDLDLIVCIKANYTVVETCNYSTGARVATVTLLRSTPIYYIIDARNQTYVLSDTISGADPDCCPGATTGSYSIKGPPPATDTFINSLRRHIYGVK